MDRWSKADANGWWSSRDWVCGFNFLPSSAVNFLEMWHPQTFDRPTIERELGWAAEIGFNALRVNLHMLVWQHDRDGLLDRLEWLVGLAARLKIQTVPCLFDDCGFGGGEPEYGPQPDPVPGVHNSRAVASPGGHRLRDRRSWPDLELYVRDIVRSFRDDPRILFWDLYNEPGNRMLFTETGVELDDRVPVEDSLALMEACFGWARAERPEQPLTVAAWTTPLPRAAMLPYQTEADQRALAMSDILSFHAYWSRPQVQRFVEYLISFNRPLVCTEWMARTVHSRIDDQLRLFHDHRIGCFQWGFVTGRTQTHLPWPDDLIRAHGSEVDRDLWFHDVLHADGSAYDPNEIATIKTLTGKNCGSKTGAG